MTGGPGGLRAYRAARSGIFARGRPLALTPAVETEDPPVRWHRALSLNVQVKDFLISSTSSSPVEVAGAVRAPAAVMVAAAAVAEATSEKPRRSAFTFAFTASTSNLVRRFFALSVLVFSAECNEIII